MGHDGNEKWQTTHDGMNRTSKSSYNANTLRKGNLQNLWMLEEPENCSRKNYIVGALSKG